MYDMPGIELIHTVNEYERLLVSSLEPDSVAKIEGIEVCD